MPRTLYLTLISFVFVLFAASAEAAETRVWLAPLELVGLDADLELAVRNAVENELAGMGAVGVEALPSCPTQACRAQAIAGAGASAGLALTVVRGEPVVQVSAVIYDQTGLEVAREDRVISDDEISAKTHLLSEESAARLRTLVGWKPPEEKKPAVTTGTTTTTTGPKTPSATGSDVVATPAEAAPATSDAPFPIAAVTGYSLVGLGAVGAVAGVGTVIWSRAIYQTPTTSTELKNTMEQAALVGVGVGVTGALLAAAGAAIVIADLVKPDSE